MMLQVYHGACRDDAYGHDEARPSHCCSDAGRCHQGADSETVCCLPDGMTLCGDRNKVIFSLVTLLCVITWCYIVFAGYSIGELALASDGRAAERHM
jgi:hypothetical protein